mgnify:CR=1 FL=1
MSKSFYETNDFGYNYPVRHRANIKRCRGVNSSDYRSPEERWDTAKMVLKATGCRRTEVLPIWHLQSWR